MRRVLYSGLIIGPVDVALKHLGASHMVLFLVATAALIPLAWLIGEATERAAHHVGPGMGGFLNATFGNAPELIIAIIAINDGLTAVVRASLAGSVIGNLLLVLGFTLLVGKPARIDRTSALMAFGLVVVATLLFLIPAIPGFHGNPDRRSLADLTLPVAAVVLAICLAVTYLSFRRQRRLQAIAEPAGGTGALSLGAALLVLGVATAMTALVTETLVGSLESFSHTVGLSEFFVAIVIVAIVGNAAEHGSAVLLAARGQMQLATEIAFASSGQVAGALIPAVALSSWLIHPLALSFRPIELVAMGGSGVLAALVLARGRASRVGGAVLLAAYVGLCVAFYVAGDR